MSIPPLLFTLLPMILVCALAQRGQGMATRRPDIWAGLARLGFGVAKIVFLALPLERLVEGAIAATPQAQSLISAWMGCLGFSFQLCFVLSGAVDLVLGMRKILGWPCAESFQDPFTAGGFSDFWRGWNASLKQAHPGRDGIFLHAAASAGVVLLCVTIARGVSWATLVWIVLQLCLLGLEWWRGGRGLFTPLPLPIRAALTVAVMVFSNILLYMPGIQAAWLEFQHLFEPPPVTVYSVILDARVTTPWPKYLLWLAMLLSVTARPLRWLLSQKSWAAPAVGIPLGILACGLLLKDQPILGADVAQHLLQRPLAVALQEGNSRVFVGRDQWLYSQQELDHLTRRRAQSPFGEGLLSFVASMRKLNKPVLVITVPDKAALYPQHILPAEYSAPVQPPGYAAALERARAAGAVVLDASDPLWAARKKMPLFFKQDSHWTPEGMKEVAIAAAKLIRQQWPAVASDETPLISANILERSFAGDFAFDLDPRAPQSLFGEETAQLVSISGVESTPRSPVLILGGDLMEVFDAPGLSFGNRDGQPQFAGFVTQLATLLGRPLDARSVADEADKDVFSRWQEVAAQKKLVICMVRAGVL